MPYDFGLRIADRHFRACESLATLLSSSSWLPALIEKGTGKMPTAGLETPTGRAQIVGAIGETLALAHLLARGWLAANVNIGGVRNMPGIDLLAMKGQRNLRVAVKTIGWGQSQAQWSIRKGERHRLFKGTVHPDIVVFIWLQIPGTIVHRTFVVPGRTVEEDVMHAHRFWFSHTRRDGLPRRDNGQVIVNFLGSDTSGNVASDFARKWTAFEEAWDLADTTSE